MSGMQRSSQPVNRSSFFAFVKQNPLKKHRAIAPSFFFLSFLKKCLAFLVLIVGLAACGGAWAGINDGLVGFWNFDNCNAQDSSPNGNNGAINGNPTCTDGINGKAYRFNGTTDYIVVPNSSSFPSSAITTSFWVNREGNAINGSLENILSKDHSFQNYAETDWHCTNCISSGLWKGSPGIWSGYYSSNNSLATSGWMHFAFIFDNATRIAKSYINGVLVNSVNEADSSAYVRTSSNSLYIGGNQFAVYYLQGLLDEVRLYNRALSDSEIQQLYSQPVGVSLSSLSFSGSNAINAGATAQFSASAGYSDSTSKSVSPTWSVSGSGATISSSGTLMASSSLTSDAVVTVNASYTENGVTKTASQSVTIKAAAPVLSSLSASCPSSVAAGASATCSASATYSNGSSSTVSAIWTSSNVAAAAMNGNTLIAGTVTADTPVTLTASYTENGVTKTATAGVTIKATAATLSGLSVNCPSTVNSGASGACTVNAAYSNATSSTVSPFWTSSNTSAAMMNGNTVIAGTVSADTPVTLTASYTENGVTRTATANVTIKAAAATLSGLTVSCPASLNAGASGTCGATASYTNGGGNTVNATWASSNTSVATVNGNTVTASGNVTTDTPVSINASYTENGVTKTATAMVSVKAAVITLTGLTVNGSSSVDPGKTATYTANAAYSDGSGKPAGNVTWTVSGSGASIDKNGVLTSLSKYSLFAKF